MLSVLNEFQRDLIAEHTSEALAYEARNGQRYSRCAPFGYQFTEDNLIVGNSREQDIISQIRRLRAEGRSVREISGELIKKGASNRNGEPFSPKAVFRILKRNP
ncbi:MAG: hypothetical protein IID41_02310 [Planctomycetes bacterium]|nr:hypothetical protein [Planctomycetota bacterium]